MSRGGHRLYAIKSDLAFLPIVVALPREKKHKSAIQDCAALAFQEFHDFLRLVSLDAHFLERRARVLEKSIEVSVVQSLRSEEHTSELQSRGHLVCRLL